MKRIWAATVILSICLIVSITEFCIVDINYGRYVNMIDTAEEYFSDKEYKIAYEISENAKSTWQINAKKLNLFLSHSKVEEIEESLEELSNAAQNKDAEQFYALHRKTKRQLLSIKESELPKLENII